MNTLLEKGTLFFKDSKKTVIFSSLIIFTLVLEEVFEAVVFRCPCENFRFYGLLFLVGPAAFLFVAGILLNSDTWWLCTIPRFLSHQKEDDCPREYRKRRCCHVLLFMAEILSKALISPTIWLILSFLQKTFYLCAVFGPGTKRSSPSNDTTSNISTPCETISPRTLHDETELMAKSQTIGLVLSLIATAIVLLLAFISRCCGFKSKLCLPDEKFYMRLEAMEAAKEFNKRAKQKAQNQGKEAVNKLFELLDGQDEGNYLAIISKAAHILDNKYSHYFNSSIRISENSDTCQDGDQNHTTTARVDQCTFEEDVRVHSLFFVDGAQIGSAECETEMATETCTTFPSDQETCGNHAQSSFTRVTLRRAKSAIK